MPFRPFLSPPFLALSLWRLCLVPLPVRTHVFWRLLPPLGSESGLAKGADSAAPAGGSGHIAQLLDSSPAGEATLQQRAPFGPSSAVDSIPA